MRHALWALTGTKPTKTVTQVILADIDTDENGVVDEDEFIEFFTTVKALKNLREDIQQGEQKAGAILGFVNVYGCICILATMLFFLAEIQSDDPDLGSNWGLFIFGIMSLIWLFFRVWVPLLMARVSYWVPIVRDIADWVTRARRRCVRAIKNYLLAAKHKILRKEGPPPEAPGSPKSPISPTVLALRAIAAFRGGKKVPIETPYQAENYAGAAQVQNTEMPLNSFKLLGKNTASQDRTNTSFAVDKPVYFLPYSQWDGGDLKAKQHGPQEAWPEQNPRQLPALQAPPQEEQPEEQVHNVSRFKALIAGEALVGTLNKSPSHAEGSALAIVDKAIEDREEREGRQQELPNATSLAERRGKKAPLAVDVPQRATTGMPKLPAENPPLKNPGV